jgi:hypothetical protein
MLRRSVGFDGLGEDGHDVVGANAAGDMMGRRTASCARR